MKNPLVSIIIPTFNSSPFIEETLISIGNQTYTNWECIIVDDGSVDNTIELIKSFIDKDKRFKFFKRPKHLLKGANTCRNYGFLKSKGNFINWFDSDDIMLENFIETKINYIKPNIELIISSGYFTDSKLENLKKIEIYQSDFLYRDYFLWRIKILTPSILFKRSFLENENLFDVNLHTSHEFDLFTRFFSKLKWHQYVILDEYLFYYRSNPNSITNFNQSYSFKLKQSEVQAVLKNLTLSKHVQDLLVYKSAYRLLINLLAKAIKYKHFSNIDLIYVELKKELFKHKFLLFIIWFVINTSKYINISFTKWDKVLKKYPINF